MLKKDYIQRQFEEFGKVLASILSRKKSKDWDAFEKEVEEAVKKFSPFELPKLEEMSGEEFKASLFQNPELLFQQKKILANLLFEKMTACYEKEEYKKYDDLHAKCLLLYEHLANDLTHNEFDLEVHYRLNLLKNKI